MVTDWILEILVSFTSWVFEFIPRLPGSVRSWLESFANGAGSLLEGVPLLNLFPLRALAIGVSAIATAQISVIGIRSLVRIFAWIRSRGSADE